MDDGFWKKISGLLMHLFKKKPFRLFLIGSGVFLVLLLFLTGILKDKKGKTETVQETIAEQDMDTYAKQLEKKLTDLLRHIKNAGTVRVMVTIEKGVEHIYATEKKASRQVTNDKNSETDTKNQQNDNTETSYILLKDSDGGQQAVSVTQIQPVVKGVVVVCDGGSDINVRKQITDAVTTALNISSAKVCVVDSK